MDRGSGIKVNDVTYGAMGAVVNYTVTDDVESVKIILTLYTSNGFFDQGNSYTNTEKLIKKGKTYNAKFVVSAGQKIKRAVVSFENVVYKK